MTKEELKQKEQLKKLTREIGFESLMFADEFGYSKKEDLRYYLWMHELNKWINNETGLDCVLSHSIAYNQLILINYISLLIHNGKLKTK